MIHFFLFDPDSDYDFDFDLEKIAIVFHNHSFPPWSILYGHVSNHPDVIASIPDSSTCWKRMS